MCNFVGILELSFVIDIHCIVKGLENMEFVIPISNI